MQQERKFWLKKVLENELEKNKKRSGKAKWNDAKVQKAADDAYKRAITNAYDQIRSEQKKVFQNIIVSKYGLILWKKSILLKCLMKV